MSTSVIPDVIDALVTRADAALTGVNVFDGWGVTNDPGDYLGIGIDDVSDSVRYRSADVQQTTGPMGTNRPRDEVGSIFCVAMSWNGDANKQAARDAAFATVAAVENLIRSDPSLGIAAGGLFVAEFGDSIQLIESQAAQGAEALVQFSIRYRARI